MGEVILSGAVEVVDESRVVRATIQRPDSLNALDSAVVAGLATAIRHAEETGAHVLAIRGAGGCFSAGADLHEISRLLDAPSDLRRFTAALSDVMDALAAGPFVSLALVEGHAVAGGCELLLACDVSLATRSARIGDGHVEYGLLPGAGGSVRLARSLPRARADYLLLTGEAVSGEQAAAWGLVSVAVDDEDFEAEARRLVKRLASRSHDSIITGKQMLQASRTGAPVDALCRERELFLDHMKRTDTREGLAAFRDRRRPAFEHWEETA